MTDDEVNAEAQEERERWALPQHEKAALEILKPLQQGEDWRAISREISWKSVSARETFNEDGHRISEWHTTMTALRNFFAPQL